MFSIFQKECRSFFSSPIAYVIMSVFLGAIGLIVWVFPNSSLLENGYSDLSSFFQLTPFILLFLIPAITMRAFSEEFKTGTIELLFTKPISDWQIIGGKFWACFFLFVCTLLPTLLYYISIYALGNPKGNIDSAAALGSYIGLLLLGAVFTAISLWASSLSENQVVSFVLGVFLCFFSYMGISSLAGLLGSNGYFLQNLGVDTHYEALSRGLIDTRDVLFLLSCVALGLFLTYLRLQKLRIG